MDNQWQPYSESNMNRPGRYAQGNQNAPQGRDFSAPSQQPQPPMGYTYENYQTPSTASNNVSMVSTPAATPHTREHGSDTDVPMEDADPYNRMKYPSRPAHQHRNSAQYLSQEESAAARRYSPMNMLSPSAPYASSPKQQSQSSYSYTKQGQNPNQSPTRQNSYSSPPQQYHASSSECHVSSPSTRRGY